MVIEVTDKYITTFDEYIAAFLNFCSESKEEKRHLKQILKSKKNIKFVESKQFFKNNRVNFTQFYANFLRLFALTLFSRFCFVRISPTEHF